MKRIAIYITVLLLCGSVDMLQAKPAQRGIINVAQPDGTTLALQMYGDEFFHYTTTTDGVLVVQDEDGYYRQAQWSNDNRLVTARKQVKAGSRTASALSIDNPAVLTRLQQTREMNRLARMQQVAVRKAPVLESMRKQQAEGEEVRGIIILAEYTDIKFKSTSTRQAIDDLMNEVGNSYKGAIGSARDYFISQSYGKFQPKFDVVGPITLDNKSSYYGANDSYDQDMRPEEIIIEACQKASAQGLCNMADYDLDKDGWVDLVYVIYAGYAESSGAAASTVWPHAWYVYQGAGKTVTVDGVKLDAYACSSELSGTSGSDMDGIGTFCHEYSHTLGIPDFYDTAGGSNFGMGEWSIMDYGCYAEDGRIPIGYMSYEREMCGWLKPIELVDPQRVAMPYIGDNEVAYKITSSNKNQYFLLESRQQKGWDVGLPAEGMMIVKIDYDASAWEQNTVNNSSSRQRVQIVPADNSLSEYSLEGDLYPYGNNNSFTSTTKPAMKIYNTVINDKPVTDIDYNLTTGESCFIFRADALTALDAPVATSAANISADGFTAYWSPVADAASYTLFVQKVVAGETEVVLTEDFSNFSTPENKNIAGTTSTDEIDGLYTQTPGWSGRYIFNSEGECKMGNKNNGGTLISPAIDLSGNDGNYIVTFLCKKHSDKDSGTVTVTMTGNGTEEVVVDLSDLSTTSMSEITLVGANGSSDSRLTIKGSKRIYIDDIVVTSGGTQQMAATANSWTYTDITTTSYDVKVDEPGMYRYKVKAVNADSESAYSNVIEVDVTTSGVASVLGSARIYVDATGIIIDGKTYAQAVVYNTQGMIEAVLPVNGKTTYRPVHSGLYIVRCGDTITKVMVK